MITIRLLAAVSNTGRGVLEEHAQRFADQTLEIKRNIAPISPQARLLAQTVAVVHTMKMTFHEWQDVGGRTSEKDRKAGAAIERWKFGRWCRCIGRKTL